MVTAAMVLFTSISPGDRPSRVMDVPSRFILTVAWLRERAPYITGGTPEWKVFCHLPTSIALRIDIAGCFILKYHSPAIMHEMMTGDH